MQHGATASAGLIAGTLGIGAGVIEIELGVARQQRHAGRGLHLFVARVVFDANPVTQLIVDPFTQAHAAAVFAGGTAYPAACPAVLAQGNAEVQVDAVIVAVRTAELPFGGRRDGYARDAGAPGCEGAAAALAVERTGPTEAAAEGAEPWMRP